MGVKGRDVCKFGHAEPYRACFVESLALTESLDRQGMPPCHKATTMHPYACAYSFP